MRGAIRGKAFVPVLLWLAVGNIATTQAETSAPDIPEPGSCAALTGDPYWLQYKNPGSISFRDIDSSRAITQCRSELSRNADDPELRYYLGRALLKHKSYDEAYAHLSAASRNGIASADLLLGINRGRGNFPSNSDTQELEDYERARDRGHVLGDYFVAKEKRSLDREDEITQSEIAGVRRATQEGWGRAWYLLVRLTLPDLPREKIHEYLKNGHDSGDINATTMLADVRFFEMTGGNVFGEHDHGLAYFGLFRMFGEAQIDGVVSLYEEVISETTSPTRKQRVTKNLVFIYLFAEGTASGNFERATELFCESLSDTERTEFVRWEDYIQIPYCGEDT